MTEASRDWLKAYLDELETAGNKMLTQLYEDEDGTPSSVVGAGSISLASYALASELATLTDEPNWMVQAVTRHHLKARESLGPDAWADVLYGALLHLAMLYLETAFKVTDSTEYDMRGAASDWWRTLSDATASATVE